MSKNELDMDIVSEKIKRGKELVYPFRYNDWVELVSQDDESIQQATDCAIEIIDAIEYNIPIEDMIEFFENYNEKSNKKQKDLTRNIIMEYSRNGYPFYEATHKSGVWTLDECERILDIMDENARKANDHAMEEEVSESKKLVLSRFKRLEKLEEKSIN